MNTDRFRGLRRIGDEGPLAAPFTCQFDVGVTRDSRDTVRPCVEQFVSGIGTPIVTPEGGHLARGESDCNDPSARPRVRLSLVYG
jgi:hypothetical protein